MSSDNVVRYSKQKKILGSSKKEYIYARYKFYIKRPPHIQQTWKVRVPWMSSYECSFLMPKHADCDHDFLYFLSQATELRHAVFCTILNYHRCWWLLQYPTSHSGHTPLTGSAQRQHYYHLTCLTKPLAVVLLPTPYLKFHREGYLHHQYELPTVK
jgi:hypothetical protein